jgi:hypothetical protein
MSLDISSTLGSVCPSFYPDQFVSVFVCTCQALFFVLLFCQRYLFIFFIRPLHALFMSLSLFLLLSLPPSPLSHLPFFLFLLLLFLIPFSLLLLLQVHCLSTTNVSFYNNLPVSVSPCLSLPHSCHLFIAHLSVSALTSLHLCLYLNLGLDSSVEELTTSHHP